MAGKWREIHGKWDFVQVSGEFEFILWFTVLVWIQIFFIIIYYFTNSSRKKKRRVTQGSESKDSDVNKPDSKSVSEVVSGVYHFKSIFCDLYTKLIFDTSCSYYHGALFLQVESPELPKIEIEIPSQLKLKLEDDCYFIKRKKKV